MQEKGIGCLMPERRIPKHRQSTQKRLSVEKLGVVLGVLLTGAKQTDSNMNVLIRTGSDYR